MSTDRSSATARLSSLLRQPKDAALAYAARKFVNHKLKGIGKLTELSINTKKKTAHVRVQLAGETEPIDIMVAKYRLRRKGEEAHLVVEEASASRAWLAAALRKFAIGRSFPIPDSSVPVAKLLT